MPEELARRLGTTDAVVVGLSAMIGAGVFAAFASAAAVAGSGAPPKAVPVLGLALCLLLAATLPAVSVLSGLAVFALGLIVWLVRRRSR